MTSDLDDFLGFTTPEGARVAYVVVTPEMARDMLDANERNRRVSRHLVDAYTRSIAADDWPFTGDAIQFDVDGGLLNGQHRLMAIEASGRPCSLLVVYNLPSTTQRYMDAGRKRSAADQLTMEGVANGAQLAATARLLLSWSHWRAHRTAITPINNEVIEYATDNVGLLTSALQHANSVYRETRASRPAIGAAFARAVQVSDDIFAVSHWFTRLATGENLRMGQPLYTLRGTLTRADQTNTLVQLFQVVRAWNAEIMGESLSKLQVPKGGVTITNFPDMRAPKVEDVSEEAEAAAEAAQRIRESA